MTDDLTALRAKAQRPGTALFALGAFNAVIGLIVAAAGFTDSLGLGGAEGAIGIVQVLVSPVVITAGLSLRGLRSRSLVLAGSILAMLPCLSGCFVLGIPVGIWALIVASGSDMTGAFGRASGRAGPGAAPDRGP